jgi:hypothetical protein
MNKLLKYSYCLLQIELKTTVTHYANLGMVYDSYAQVRLMWQAGTTHGVPPLRLSLQGTRHQLDNFIPLLLDSSRARHHHIYQALLKIIVYARHGRELMG